MDEFNLIVCGVLSRVQHWLQQWMKFSVHFNVIDYVEIDSSLS